MNTESEGPRGHGAPLTPCSPWSSVLPPCEKKLLPEASAADAPAVSGVTTSGIAGTTCHCEAHSAEAIPCLTSVLRLARQEIASALCA